MKNIKLCPGCDKPLYEARAQSKYGHGEICSNRLFNSMNCVLKEKIQGNFIQKRKDARNKQK